jgi:hypothetical protein
MALAKDDIKIADYLNFAQQSLEQLIRLARQVSELFAKRKEIRETRAELTTDLDLDIPTYPEKVKANHAKAEDDFANTMGDQGKKIIARQARNADPETFTGSEFLKDLVRSGDVEVGRTKLPITDTNGNTLGENDTAAQRSLHQQVDDIIGDFLAEGNPHFTNASSDEQKLQIRILEALCNQALPIAAKTANDMGILGGRYVLDGENPLDSTMKYTITRDDDGNFVVAVDYTANPDMLSKKSDGEMNPLDQANSVNKITASVSITPVELGRLSKLTWTDTTVPPAQLPDAYTPKFVNKSVKGSMRIMSGTW